MWCHDHFLFCTLSRVYIQVWRPSPTVDDSTGTGCYSLVGNNRFTSISLSNGVAQVTPSPQDYIQFRPGDVLGFYVEEASEATDGVVVLTTSSFTSELVWYASIAPTAATSQNENGDCPYSFTREQWNLRHLNTSSTCHLVQLELLSISYNINSNISTNCSYYNINSIGRYTVTDANINQQFHTH
jgi:hypothetical protein